MHIQELYSVFTYYMSYFFGFYVGFALGPFTASFGGVSGGSGARVTFFNSFFFVVIFCNVVSI